MLTLFAAHPRELVSGPCIKLLGQAMPTLEVIFSVYEKVPEGRHPYIGQLSTDAVYTFPTHKTIEMRTKLETIALTAMTRG